MYMDLLMRVISHKAVQKSELDQEVKDILRPEVLTKAMESDPSSVEAAWDLPWSVIYGEQGKQSELNEKQCTKSGGSAAAGVDDPHQIKMTENCPATTMTASQLLMTRLLSASQISQNIPGDFLEAGVWRGGMTVLLRGVLASKNVVDRVVYACDSYEGIPDGLEPGADANNVNFALDENGEIVLDEGTSYVWNNR
jgi:hypothetical protein